MATNVAAQKIISDGILTRGSEDGLDRSANVGRGVEQGPVYVEEVGGKLWHRHARV